MPETFEQHFAQTPEEKPKSLKEIREEKALVLAEEIREIQEKIQRGELVGEKAIEGYQRIIELTNEIKRLYKKEIIGWQLEGKLTEENVLLEYQVGNKVYTANFSPEGDKVAIGALELREGAGPYGTNAVFGEMQVISLTETDEKGKPKVLLRSGGAGPFRVANFSPEGDRVLIGLGDLVLYGYEIIIQFIYLTKIDEGYLSVYDGVEGGDLCTANFFPGGDKVMVVTAFTVKVISITTDEEGNYRPRILANYFPYEEGKSDKIHAANLSPGGDKMVVGSENGMVTVLSLTERNEEGKIILQVLTEYQAEAEISAANFSPEGDEVVIGTGNKIQVISLTKTDKKGKPRVLTEYQAEAEISAANFSPEGDEVVIGTGNKIQVISLTKTDKKGNIIPQVLAEYQAEAEISAANFSPEGNKIVIGCDNGKVKVIGTP